MRTKTIRRAMIAGVVALGLAVVPVEPADALDPAWEVTAGDIEVRDFFDIFPLDFDLANPPTDPCTVPAPPASIDVVFDDPSPGDIAATLDSKSRVLNPFDMSYYQIDIHGEGNGTYQPNPSPPPDFDVDLTMDFDVDFYAISPPNDCEKGTPVCHWDVDGADFTGAHVGTVPPTAGDTVTLDSDGAAPIDVGEDCDFPFDVYTGGTVEVLDLVAVFQ